MPAKRGQSKLEKLCTALGMLVLSTWLQRGASSFLVCLPWLLLLLVFVAALMKTSSQEEHTRLNAKIILSFALSLPRRQNACEEGTEQSSTNFALSLACCSWPLGFNGVPDVSIGDQARWLHEHCWLENGCNARRSFTILYCTILILYAICTLRSRSEKQNQH